MVKDQSRYVLLTLYSRYRADSDRRVALAIATYFGENG